MSRILERYDDYRPLMEQVMAEPPDEDLLARYNGTELVQCWGEDQSCTRAVVARGPFDIALMLLLVDDEGWAYHDGKHYCPVHSQGMGFTGPSR